MTSMSERLINTRSGVAPGARRLRAAFLAAACVAAASVLLTVVQSPAISQGRGPESVAPLAEKLIDAVVNISTSQSVKGPSGAPLPNVPKGSPFEELFDDFFNPKGKGGRTERKQSSLGSGFVIDAAEGLIVTNNHVIEGADEIVINFNDGTKLKVDRVVGRDTKTDLALLKVTPKKKLAAVPFGDSGRVRVGDWVLAIGNPFGLGGSVSIGIISAKQRDISSGPYDDYLQTDAAINRGNSGGPLFNMAGEVIGVNTAIISPSGGSIGIGFSVPSDSARFVAEQLRKYGEVRRGWLGVRIQSVNENFADDAVAEEGIGAMVSSVTTGSPAAAAGIKTRDVILKFDGKSITSVRGLPRAVAQTEIGRSVPVEIKRDGKLMTVTVTVGRLPDEPADKGGAGSNGEAIAGLKLAPLTDELRQKYGLEKKTSGLVIVEVAPKSIGAVRGLKVGEVIAEIGNEPATSISVLTKGIEAARRAGRRNVLLKIETAKGEIRSIGLPVE